MGAPINSAVNLPASVTMDDEQLLGMLGILCLQKQSADTPEEHAELAVLQGVYSWVRSRMNDEVK